MKRKRRSSVVYYGDKAAPASNLKYNTSNKELDHLPYRNLLVNT